MQACQCRPLTALHQQQHRPSRPGLRLHAAHNAAAGAGSEQPRSRQRIRGQQQAEADAAGRQQLAQAQFQSDPAAHGPAVQQQQPTGYVAEPWEVSEPWEVAEQQQQLYNGQQVANSWLAGQQPRQHLPAQQGSLASSVLPGAGEAEDDDGGVWLLDDDLDDDAEQEEGAEQQEHDEAGLYYIGEADEAEKEQQLWQGGRQLMQDMQRAMQPPQELQQLREQQQVRQQQQPPASGSTQDLQAAWEQATAAAASLLASYDVRYDVQRPPHLSSSRGRLRGPAAAAGGVGPEGLGPAEVCLTAAAAAAAAAKARRVRKPQAPAEPPVPTDVLEQEQSFVVATAPQPAPQQQQQQQQNQQQQQRQQRQQQQQQVLLPDDDPRWRAVLRSHAAYLSYMQQLAGMVVSKQQQGHQLVYQVGICEHWLQLAHMLTVMGGPDLPPAVCAAMWKRLPGIVSRKVFVRMSQAERVHYDLFIEQFVQQTTTSIISSSCSSSDTSSKSSSSSRAASRRPSRGGRGSTTCKPSHLAATAYGMAVLGVSSPPLAAAVEQAAAGLLQQAATAVSAAAEDAALRQPPAAAAASEEEAAGVSSAAAAAAAVAAAEVCGWTPADIASLLWGLGMLRHCPSQQWLQHVTSVSQHMLASLQPSQLWGVLWGLSQMAHLPPPAWMASWLAAARQQLDKFDAEGLAHAGWALAALGHVPDKLWLRAFAGMVAHRVRSFMAPQLAMVLPALSSLGYKPRAEVCRTLVAQVRRQLHTLKPSQLAAVLAALASYPPAEGAPASTSGWHPGRLFLFDFISASAPPGVMQAWSGHQAAQVLWAFSRFRYVPDASYLHALLVHLGSQLPATGADGLALAAWGLAALRQPLPSPQWGDAWCAAALAAADGFGPQALTHGLSGMAALRMQPPAELMQALTRTASGCLSSCSCMELGLLIAALADLHWRPSDAWMAAFVSQVSQQLPAFENEDYGLLLHGLAALGQPLSPALLGRFAAEAGRKLYGLSGEGLGLLVWGLAQYDYTMKDAEEWWDALYDECAVKWESATLRGCALMATGLAQLGPRHLPPGEWEAAFITRYKAVSSRPASWQELLLGLRLAAGLEPGEVLQLTPWLSNLLLQLGRAWGLQEPQQQGGLAAVLAEVDAQVEAAAAAAVAYGGAAGDTAGTGAASAAAVRQADGRQAIGQPLQADVEPTSATAVLL